MAHFTDVLNRSDFDLQCEAARLSSRSAGTARLLQSTLEGNFSPAVELVSIAKTEADMLSLWEEALQSGDVRGAYWAIVTDSRATPRLRQIVTQELDQRRPETLGLEVWKDAQQLELLQAQLSRVTRQRERDAAEMAALRVQMAAIKESWGMNATLLEAAKDARTRAESLSTALKFQVGRREQAEMASLAAESNALCLQKEAEQLRHMLAEFGRELSTVEEHIRHSITGAGPASNPLGAWVGGRKILYIGGRRSANVYIRALVESLGGEYRRHEGGIDVGSRPLDEALAWADMVVAPRDCLERESSDVLKRACQLNGVDHVSLRTASVTGFVVGIQEFFGPGPLSGLAEKRCLRHR